MNDTPLPAQAGVRPCEHCGSTAAIVEVDAGKSTIIRRLCCGAEPWWRSPAGRAWFMMRGLVTDLAPTAEVRSHG